MKYPAAFQNHLVNDVIKWYITLPFIDVIDEMILERTVVS